MTINTDNATMLKAKIRMALVLMKRFPECLRLEELRYELALAGPERICEIYCASYQEKNTINPGSNN
jgi:hypothetical protein